MIIKLADMDLSNCTTVEQAKKVNEEIKEFMLAQAGGQPNLDHIAEEAFVTIQAIIGYLKKLGIDVEIANNKHVLKMSNRGNKPRERRSESGRRSAV